MVEVSAGIIIHDSKILCFQKGMAKYPYLAHKWEFPGGKVEKGEDPRDTIIRELSEELKMDISHQKIEFLCDTEYDYPDFHLLMHSFLIFVNDPHFTLTEHISSKWCTVEELNGIDWAEADKAVVKAIEEYYA
ncbi:MAG: (deoxy)nucleoside triphosphate pyrophosphohydrolase [Candidatus Methanomethylophilaceae archaeon]|nr:(deoxy)nucleoside triphosphate pyrophosphohydrolase [Candidatus Methanomethylophilaceae archaeon]